MRILSYIMLALALALTATLLAGLVWAATHIDWTLEPFSARFWTKTPEDIRNAVLVFGGVVAAAIGLALTGVRTHAANEQARVAEQGHITDRFTKAIEQLGSDKLEVRLGGIYALERIARDSRRDHWPIMETLTAYIRRKVPWPPVGQLSFSPHTGNSLEPTTEVQALLTVIGRRRKRYDVAGQRLDLRATDLRGADLRRAHLERAGLSNVHLEGANLNEAHLERANLGGANLEGAKLEEAHLEGAKLKRSNLTQEQLDQAWSDKDTELPDGLVLPTRSILSLFTAWLNRWSFTRGRFRY
jgi:Pentapeptide repeats (8 copies)